MKKTLFILAIISLAAILLLSACSDKEAVESPSPEPVEESPSPSPSGQDIPSPEPTATPDPEPVILNPLTGLPIDEAYVNRRPVAIMINNIKQAMPQFGLMKADII